MTRYTYPAIITHYPEGPDYVVAFPDFPDVSACDINTIGALELMNAVLGDVIIGYLVRKIDLPEPTPFEQHLHQDDECVSWWTMAQCGDGIPVEDERRLNSTDNGIPVDEVQAAFHENRPKTSNLMRIVKSRLV